MIFRKHDLDFDVGPVPCILPALIAAGAAIGGSYMANQANKENAEHTNNQNWTIWREQRDDANTAHQREVEDLKKAGLNPTLSAGGNGAPTPSPGSPMAPPPPVNVPDIVPALNLLFKKQELDNETARVKNQTDLTSAEIAKKKVDQGRSEVDTELKRRDLKRGRGRDLIQDGINEIIEWTKKKTDKPFNKYKMPSAPGNMTIPAPVP